jgi:hypothetical protein
LAIALRTDRHRFRRQPRRRRTVEGRRLLQVLEEGGHRRRPAERNLPREELEGHDAQRVHVAPGVEGVAARLLRAHVLGRPHDEARGGGAHRGLGPELLGDAEVHEPDHALAVHHQVRGLEVPVDDARLVDGLEALGHADAGLEGLVGRERALLRHHPPQVGALDVLHGDVAQPALLAVLVDPADVAVAHAAGEADLRAEAALHVAVVPHVGAQHLEGHGLLERVVPRLVHRAHAALAQRGQDLVAAGHHRAALEVDLRPERVAAVEAAVRGVGGVVVAGGALHAVGTGAGFYRERLRPPLL